jgi:hypothetical protein
MLFSALLVALANAAQPFSYMDELRDKEEALAEALQKGSGQVFAASMLAFARTYVDASAEAQTVFFSTRDLDPPTPDQAAANAGQARRILAEYEPREALPAIVAAARDRQIVILNEAHYSPRHRAFSTLLALELRKLGFEYLAVETLDNRTQDVSANLQARGYPLVEDGYYSKEPVYGDLLRRGLAAGYQVVAYEFTSYDEAYEKLDGVEQQVRREAGQAQNIIDKVLARNPRARIFVHAGHGHVEKGLSDFGERKIALMAEQLRQKTGIDPLCVEQTRSAWPRWVQVDKPLTEVVLRTFRGESFVLALRQRADPGAGFWNAGNVDIQVWHRPETLRQGRPDWLSLVGYRRPMKIPAKLLPRQGRRLVQAFVEGESADAVPMDQVLVTAGQTPPVFMLPRGKYRFAWQD